MMKQAVIVLAMAGATFAQTIATPPSLFTCVPRQLTWTGTAPFFLNALPGGQVGGTPLKQFGQFQDTSYTWTDLAAGTTITLALTDATGQTAYTSPITIQAGTIDSCLSGNAASGSDSSSSTAAATSSSSESEDSSSTMTMTSTSTDMTMSSSMTGAAASSSSPVTSDARKVAAGFGAVAAGVVAALL